MQQGLWSEHTGLRPHRPSLQAWKPWEIAPELWELGVVAYEGCFED